MVFPRPGGPWKRRWSRGSRRLPGRLDGDGEGLLHLLLPDELRQPLGPEGEFRRGVLLEFLRRRDFVLSGHGIFYGAREPVIGLERACRDQLFRGEISALLEGPRTAASASEKAVAPGP